MFINALDSGIGRYSSKGVHYYQITHIACVKINHAHFRSKTPPICIKGYSVKKWIVSSPDSTLEERKGSGDFGQKAWSNWWAAEEFAHPNLIAAAYDLLAAGPLSTTQTWIAYTHSLTGQSDPSFVQAHPCWRVRPEPAKPRTQPKVTRPFPLLLEVGSGDKTKKWMVNQAGGA